MQQDGEEAPQWEGGGWAIWHSVAPKTGGVGRGSVSVGESIMRRKAGTWSSRVSIVCGTCEGQRVAMQIDSRQVTPPPLRGTMCRVGGGGRTLAIDWRRRRRVKSRERLPTHLRSAPAPCGSSRLASPCRKGATTTTGTRHSHARTTHTHTSERHRHRRLSARD